MAGYGLENLEWEVEEVLYYPYSENKGADQLRGYRTVDLCLCFGICKKQVFSRHTAQIIFHKILTAKMPFIL